MMSNKHKWAEVIHAYAEGKEIQWRFIKWPSDWENLHYNQNPEFNNTNIEWRIKPHKHQDIIDAYRRGETVQYYDSDNWPSGWVDISPKTMDLIIAGDYHQGLNSEIEKYRIKPKPKPDIVKTGRIYLDDAEYLCWNEFNFPDNVKFTFDGETRELKDVEMLED